MNEASSSRSSLDSASACPTTEQSQPNIYPIFKKAKKNHNKSRVLDAPVVPTSTNQSGSASGSGSKKRQRQAEKSPSPELDPAAWDEFVDRWGTRKHDQDNYESDDAPFEAEWKVNKVRSRGRSLYFRFSLFLESDPTVFWVFFRRN